MTHQCATGCGRTVHGAFVCVPCGNRLHDALAELLDRADPTRPYERIPGLLANLDETIARQTALERPTTTRTDPEPYDAAAVPGAARRGLPIDLRAVEAEVHLRAILVGWVRLLVEESAAHPATRHRIDSPGLTGGSVGNPYPPDTLRGLAAFLAARVETLRCHEAGNEAVDEITAAVARVRRVVDIPLTRHSFVVGPCPELGCSGIVHAHIPVDRDRSPHMTCTGSTPHRYEAHQWNRAGRKIASLLERRIAS